MESDDDKDFTNGQQYIEFSDQNLYQVWRPNQSCKLPNILDQKPNDFPKRVMRKSRRIIYSCFEKRRMCLNMKRREYPSACNAVSLNTKTEFKDRKLTTIPEEVFHYKRHSKSLSAFKEKKNYQEKVASLTITVGRLKEMCLAKPEVLQDSVPEEVMKLMSSIQI